ncbi:MAG: ferrochelatase [Candidatus Melainabacteria bacterium HGW-Melainabacteria-1]|nr:MAG: ferrochelatase [Candidatus Melainabacteria bacterium HGW-Melainabacteria-1]
MLHPGILLVNLGSPASTQPKDVATYLDEFLMDDRVIDMPWLPRRLLVSFIKLTGRPKRSAEAYAKVWGPEGSPLVHLSRQLRDQVQLRTELPVELAMRYGQPNIEAGLRQLRARGAEAVRLVPLYPHYAMSSFETVVVKVKAVLASIGWDPPLTVLPPFYVEPDYIAALVASAREQLNWDYDHVLFSYHGIPLRQVLKVDPGSHCLEDPEGFPPCCARPDAAHAYCYRHQVLATTEAFVAAAGIAPDQYSIAFQSRLGRTPWLRPYTDYELPRLAAAGKKNVLILSPSFVSDCLETLEELAIRAVELFLESGGTELRPVPCLNLQPDWVKTLVSWCEDDARFVPASPGSKALSPASGR